MENLSTEIRCPFEANMIEPNSKYGVLSCVFVKDFFSVVVDGYVVRFLTLGDSVPCFLGYSFWIWVFILQLDFNMDMHHLLYLNLIKS